MRGDSVGAEALGEFEADLLHEATRVDEDERGTMLLGECGELVVDLGPHGRGCDGAEFGGGDFDGEIEGAALADLDDGCGLAMGCASDEEVGDELDGVLRRREADALRRCCEAGEESSGSEVVFAAD